MTRRRRPVIIPPAGSVLTAEQAAAMIRRHEWRQRRERFRRYAWPPLRLAFSLGLLAWSLGLI